MNGVTDRSRQSRATRSDSSRGSRRVRRPPRKRRAAGLGRSGGISTTSGAPAKRSR